MVRVQRIRVPDTGHLSWIVVDLERFPLTVVNEYILFSLFSSVGEITQHGKGICTSSAIVLGVPGRAGP